MEFAVVLLRQILRQIGQLADRLSGEKNRLIVDSDTELGTEILEELERRARHFRPDLTLDLSKRPPRRWPSAQPRLFMGSSRHKVSPALRFLSHVYFVDWRIDPVDGVEWCRLAGHGRESEIREACEVAERRFRDAITKLRALALQRAYLFGTGPSLASAGSHDWKDGYRVVCNTIVRDQSLWHRLRPHFVVAGDAIYHFGASRHSRQFMTDLDHRLAESPETLFVYPALFHPVVAARLQPRAKQLIPVPLGRDQNPIADLSRQFELPRLGNVLNLLLLPLGCTLARDIGLWGFDGRDPQARSFWSNSGRHSYPELTPEMRAQHPAFFADAVPIEDPTRYVRTVHGDGLDQALARAESQGFRFEMLHPSWTPTLAKRYLGNEAVESYFEALRVAATV